MRAQILSTTRNLTPVIVVVCRAIVVTAIMLALVWAIPIEFFAGRILAIFATLLLWEYLREVGP